MNLLLIGPLVLMAAYPYPSPPPANVSEHASQSAEARIVEEVQAADSGVWEAVNACNVERWNRIVADDLLLISVGGRTFDKPQLRDDFFGTTLHPVPCDTEYGNEPMRTRVFGNIAVVNGNTTLKGNGKGRLRELTRFAYTRVFEKRDGVWRLVVGQHTTTKVRLTGPF